MCVSDRSASVMEDEVDWSDSPISPVTPVQQAAYYESPPDVKMTSRPNEKNLPSFNSDDESLKLPSGVPYNPCKYMIQAHRTSVDTYITLIFHRSERSRTAEACYHRCTALQYWRSPQPSKALARGLYQFRPVPWQSKGVRGDIY